MTFALDIRHDGLSCREFYTSDFTVCGVWFFGFHCEYLGADDLFLEGAGDGGGGWTFCGTLWRAAGCLVEGHLAGLEEEGEGG